MKKPLYKHLYAQVLFAITCGVLLGHFYPDAGAAMKPLGDGFIKLIKMIIAPIIFCTVVTGIAGMEDMKKVGRVGGKALLYFEVVSTIALFIGLFVVNTLKPGVGMNIDVTTLDTKALASLHHRGQVAEHRRFPAQHHPHHRGRCVCQRRDSAGVAVRGAVRFRHGLRRGMGPARRRASSRRSPTDCSSSSDSS